jgi:hypothetical protein
MAAGWGENLIDNGAFETCPTQGVSGWEIIQNGGSGYGCSSGHSGSYGIITSYDWFKIRDEIDLVSKGYSTSQLDSAPDVDVSAWFRGHYSGQCADRGSIKVELRNSGHGLITEWLTGTFSTPSDCSWTQKSNTFSGYGTGLRYIYIEIWGMDVEYWAGQYGSVFDDVNVHMHASDTSPPAITISSVGGDSSSPYVTTDNSPAVVFSTDENAWCRWSTSDYSYASMSNQCGSGEGGTSHTCTSSTLSDGARNLYIQ